MWKYLKSREFWLTVAGLFALGIVCFFLTFYLILPWYTKHGETVTVPDIVRLSLEDGKIRLEENDLKFEVRDSAFHPDIPPFTIVSQDPPPLSKVKPGRRIFVKVNRKVAPMTTFPKENVKNVSNYQAKMTLERFKLTVDSIEYVPHDFRNVVVEVKFKGKYLKGGEMLPEGSRLTLVVGKGLGRQRIPIPELVGMSYTTAISVLHEIGLNIGNLRFNPEATDAKGTIYRQNPAYSLVDSLFLGEPVDLFIAGQEPDEALELPVAEEEIIQEE